MISRSKIAHANAKGNTSNILLHHVIKNDILKNPFITMLLTFT